MPRDPVRYAEYQREWRRANPDRSVRYTLAYRDRNGEKVRSYQRERAARVRREDPEKHRTIFTKANLAKYCKAVGITVEEYEAVKTEQNNLCFLCGDPPKRSRLSLDHNHDTGKFRALLCTNCNTGLGMFRDNPELLRKAAEYVETK